MAIALLNYSDDEGYFLAEASLIRAACCPLRDDSGTVPGLVQILIKAEWIEVTWSDGRGPIGRVCKFRENQVINKPKASKIKQYWGIAYEYGTNPEPIRESSGTDTVRNGSGIRDQGREQGRPKSGPSEERDDDMAKKKIAVQEQLIPDALQGNPEFMETWKGFLEMRIEIKKPATELAQKILLRKLRGLSEENASTAITILENSIVNSWQDIYAVKSNQINGRNYSLAPSPGNDPITITGED